jgi:MFS family permease
MSSGSAHIYGMVAEFLTSADVIAAARRLKSNGFTEWDVYGPAPIAEIEEVVPTRRGLYITIIMVVAAVGGAVLGYFIQYWAHAINYPLNVGGRPYNGWPGFVPVAWEVCALFTVYAGFFAFVVLCRLPRLYHPIFSAPSFDRASQDRFVLCVEASDPHYQADRLRWLFERYGAVRVDEVAS